MRHFLNYFIFPTKKWETKTYQPETTSINAKIIIELSLQFKFKSVFKKRDEVKKFKTDLIIILGDMLL